VVLIPPHAVRPYVLRNKTDGADAKGLLEPLRNDDVRPVPVKSVDQHVLAALHRMRSAWMATRTARLNLLRGLLRELGFSIPVGARQVVPHVWEHVSGADSGLPAPSGQFWPKSLARSVSSRSACARSSARSRRCRLRTWALDRERARGHNKAAVALANKLARIVWAVWRNERPFTRTAPELEE